MNLIWFCHRNLNDVLFMFWKREVILNYAWVNEHWPNRNAGQRWGELRMPQKINKSACNCLLKADFLLLDFLGIRKSARKHISVKRFCLLFALKKLDRLQADKPKRLTSDKYAITLTIRNEEGYRLISLMDEEYAEKPKRPTRC